MCAHGDTKGEIIRPDNFGDSRHLRIIETGAFVFDLKNDFSEVKTASWKTATIGGRIA